MQKTITKFEIKKDERVYQFLMENDSPLGELHDVLLEMREHVIQVVNKVIEDQKSQSKTDDSLEIKPDA